jgi:hypothetical protein
MNLPGVSGYITKMVGSICLWSHLDCHFLLRSKKKTFYRNIVSPVTYSLDFHHFSVTPTFLDTLFFMVSIFFPLLILKKKTSLSIVSFFLKLAKVVCGAIYLECHVFYRNISLVSCLSDFHHSTLQCKSNFSRYSLCYINFLPFPSFPCSQSTDFQAS